MPSFTIEHRRGRHQRSPARRDADAAFGVPAVQPVAATFRPGTMVRTPLTGGELATLESLADRIERNEPRSGDPESFHVEASEIRKAFRRVIGALRTGQHIPQIEDREHAAKTGRPSKHR